ncbi:MAG: hypothetical protein ACFFAE_13585 [Candidatus Hodarchaeota archaeon]
MIIIAFQLRHIHEKKVVIVLPKTTLHLRKVFCFVGILSVSSVSLFYLLISLGPMILYRLIPEIILLAVALLGVICGSYGLFNTLYNQPILVLTPNDICLGKKVLFRSPYVKTSGIIPKEDLKLIIVRDSKSNMFKLYLEGRKLLQLGIYKTFNEIKHQRMQLRKTLADFYPYIYISIPKYHEI